MAVEIVFLVWLYIFLMVQWKRTILLYIHEVGNRKTMRSLIKFLWKGIYSVLNLEKWKMFCNFERLYFGKWYLLCIYIWIGYFVSFYKHKPWKFWKSWCSNSSCKNYQDAANKNGMYVFNTLFQSLQFILRNYIEVSHLNCHRFCLPAPSAV